MTSPKLEKMAASTRTEAEARANASLIAAAPELLEAVKEVLFWCEDDVNLVLNRPIDREDWVGVLRSRARFLRAAVAKAEGREP